MLYVSIGRNVNGTPMSRGEWLTFQAQVLEVFRDSGFGLHDTLAEGVSRWGNESEGTAVFVWFHHNEPLSRLVQRALAEVAKSFGQEAIAWSVAGTNFVKGV
jgi:hypothetical protein